MNTTSKTTLQIIREIHAPISSVFAAWTHLELTQKWWGPEDVHTRELVIEPRVGGKLWWVLSSPDDGDEMTAQGVISDVSPGEKIAFTWHWLDDRQWENHESLVTVTFRAEGSAITEICLTHENLPSEASRDNHAKGWSSALDRLERFLTAELHEAEAASVTREAA